MTPRCKCHPDSPFLYLQNPRASIFSEDKTYRPRTTTGLSASHMSTSVVERERAAGKTVGTLYGMGRSNPIPPVGDFHVFAKAGKDKVNFATIHKDR